MSGQPIIANGFGSNTTSAAQLSQTMANVAAGTNAGKEEMYLNTQTGQFEVKPAGSQANSTGVVMTTIASDGFFFE